MGAPTETRRGRSPHAVSTAADVNARWARLAIERGLLDPHALEGEDVIVVKALAFLNQIVWPGQRRDPKDVKELDLWQILALNTVRDALVGGEANPHTTVWVDSKGSFVTHTQQEAAAYAARSTGHDLTAVRIPVGAWAAALPHPFEIRQLGDSPAVRLVAQAAGAPVSLLHRLADADLADLHDLTHHDVILLKVANSLQGLWLTEDVGGHPERNFPSWLAHAITTVRTALESGDCTPESNVWVVPNATHVTHTLGQAAQWLVDSSHGPHHIFKLPLGSWITRIPDPFVQ
ncbi:hypothetical protein [Streptomyces sp. NPDC002644]